MLLRHQADRRTLAYMVVTTALFGALWLRPALPWGEGLPTLNGLPLWLGSMGLYVLYLFLSIAVTVIAHNHNHLPIFRSAPLNHVVDYWLTVFYGFPAFGWIPTHNKNHHVRNNREGDYTLTYRLTEHNHLGMLLIYPSMSSYFQQKPIRDYLVHLRKTDRAKFWTCVFQYVALVAWIGAFLWLDWRKALAYVVIPQQVGLFSVLVFNFVQHVHADEESSIDHSRNFTGFLNVLLFNNGFHTVHHDKAGAHWSVTPAMHAAIAPSMNPALIEKSFWGFLFRSYVLGALAPRFRTKSLRLERMARLSGQAADTPA